MNVELLREVKQYILDHPDEYDQGEWCGTRCCVAGHAAVLSGRITRELMLSSAVVPESIEPIAQEVLDLTFGQADRLFAHWPPPFKDVYTYSNKTRVELAQLAADRIDFFIETDGSDGRYGYESLSNV